MVCFLKRLIIDQPIRCRQWGSRLLDYERYLAIMSSDRNLEKGM